MMVDTIFECRKISGGMKDTVIPGVSSVAGSQIRGASGAAAPQTTKQLQGLGDGRDGGQTKGGYRIQPTVDRIAYILSPGFIRVGSVAAQFP
jgi:hypothetical protein